MRHTRKLGLWLSVLVLFFGISTWTKASFRIPSTLKEIGAGAFEGTNIPAYIDIPSGVEKIGPRAFADTGLIEVWISSKVKEIASDAFDSQVAFLCPPGSYAESW